MRQSLLVAMCVCLLAAASRAATDGDYEYTNNGDGTCTITRYIGPGGDITIPDTLASLTVTFIGDYAFAFNHTLTSVTIPNSVTTIWHGAFMDCSGLTCVTIGSNVTFIGHRAFYYCSGLTGIYFKGDAPALGSNVFDGVNATVYYIPGTMGWGSTFGGLPTVMWPLSVADVDMSGDVNLADFAVFAAAWGASSIDDAYDPLCDLADPAGEIDTADLAVFADQWLITPCP